MSYTPTEGDEVEDLYRLIGYVKTVIPDLAAVSCGAIASDYQRLRVEQCCSRLKLACLAFMWKQDQLSLLDGMLQHSIHAVLIKTAVLGLHPIDDLGKSLNEARPKLIALNDEFGVNICGEGGEYETIVLNSPFFRFASIKIEDSEIVRESEMDNINPVGILLIKSHRLEAKENAGAIPESQVVDIPYSMDLTETNGISRGSRSDEERLLESLDGLIHLQSNPDESRDLALEFHGALISMKEQVESLGRSLDDVVFISLYLKDMEQFRIINGVYTFHLPSLNPPTRACVQLELTSSAFRLHWVISRRPKRVLHVQSRSTWAPSCIGPYSQATSIGNLSFIAGTIGLVPEMMNFEGLSFQQEIKLALEHCQSIAVDIGGDLKASAVKINIYLSYKGLLEWTESIKEEFERLLEIYLPTHVWWKDKEIQKREVCKQRELYLNPMEFDVEISPLVSFVVVPALPIEARIEVQPIVLNAKCSQSVNSTDSKIAPPMTQNQPVKLKSVVSEILCFEVRHSVWLIPDLHDYCELFVSVLECGESCGFLQICVPSLPQIPDPDWMASYAVCCSQWLNDWLQESVYGLDQLQSLVMWYIDSTSLEFVTKLDSELKWKESMILPAKAVGSDLSLSANAIIDIYFANLSD
eukprot:g6091.t1